MAARPTPTGRAEEATPRFDGAFRLVVIGAVALIVLTVVRLLADAGSAPSAGASSPSAAPTAAAEVAAVLVDPPTPAPPLDLVGPDGGPMSLGELHGGVAGPSLVFFGYTHCPDVCPATIGTISEAIARSDRNARALLVSVDPERDTVPWLAEFARYLPSGFSAATGTPAQIATTAAAWGVRYARVETDDPAAYSMSHTADVFLVDAQGQLRARFPFGTTATTIASVLATVEGTGPAAPSASATSTAAADLWPEVVSSSVWAGGSSPVIIRIHDSLGTVDDASLRVQVTVVDGAGQPIGRSSPATAVTPSGISEVSFVASVDIPAPGTWRLAVDALDANGATRSGTVDVVGLDPGGSAALGGPAPAIRTSTAADVGGDLTWLTTDPLPDPRLSATSTADALAAGSPFVLVVDSAAFKVTPACGKALGLAKRLLDRWRAVPFIHHEPYRYDVITTEPVLVGTLADPTLTGVAEAWGVGAAPWGVGSMPWVFIVDGEGVVRAKYQGVVGSADVDVILSLLTAGA